MNENCSICNYTNVGLINIGNPGTPRMVCLGCVKRTFDTIDELDRTFVHVFAGYQAGLVPIKSKDTFLDRLVRARKHSKDGDV